MARPPLSAPSSAPCEISLTTRGGRDRSRLPRHPGPRAGRARRFPLGRPRAVRAKPIRGRVEGDEVALPGAIVESLLPAFDPSECVDLHVRAKNPMRLRRRLERDHFSSGSHLRSGDQGEQADVGPTVDAHVAGSQKAPEKVEIGVLAVSVAVELQAERRREVGKDPGPTPVVVNRRSAKTRDRTPDQAGRDAKRSASGPPAPRGTIKVHSGCVVFAYRSTKVE